MPPGDREHAVVVACAAGRPPRPEIASEPLNWNDLWADGDRHMVLPAVMTALESARPLPSLIAERWHDLSARVTRDNLSALTQLSAVLGTLSGLDAVAWKGPAFLAASGQQLQTRWSCDLDVLVRREQLPQIRERLIAGGYRPMAVASWTPRDARREYPFEPPAAGMVLLEIQTAIAIWPLAVRLDVTDLIERSIVTTAHGRPIRTLGPEDNLLALAVHGATHGWGQLRCLADLDACVRQPLDWDVVLARARAARMQRILATGLLLASSVLDSPVPPDVAGAMRTDRVAGLLVRLLGGHLRGTGTPRYRDWIGFLSREGLADKARYASRQLFLRQVGVRADRAARRRAAVQ